MVQKSFLWKTSTRVFFLLTGTICLPTSSLCKRHLQWTRRSFCLPEISTPTWSRATEAVTWPERRHHGRYHSETIDSSLPGEISETEFYMLPQRTLSGRGKRKKIPDLLMKNKKKETTGSQAVRYKPTQLTLARGGRDDLSQLLHFKIRN